MLGESGRRWKTYTQLQSIDHKLWPGRELCADKIDKAVKKRYRCRRLLNSKSNAKTASCCLYWVVLLSVMHRERQCAYWEGRYSYLLGSIEGALLLLLHSLFSTVKVTRTNADILLFCYYRRIATAAVVVVRRHEKWREAEESHF